MDYEKKEHKKIQNTKAALLQALTELSSEMPVEQISVSALCRQAKINRTTFYKYYKIPADVLEEKIRDLVKDCMPSYNRTTLEEKTSGKTSSEKNVSPETEIYQKVLRSCRTYYDHRELLTLYLNMGADLLPIFYSTFQHPTSLDSVLEDHAMECFASGGVASIIMQWGIQGYRQSPEEIASLLSGFITRIQPNGSY